MDAYVFLTDQLFTICLFCGQFVLVTLYRYDKFSIAFLQFELNNEYKEMHIQHRETFSMYYYVNWSQF